MLYRKNHKKRRRIILLLIFLTEIINRSVSQVLEETNITSAQLEEITYTPDGRVAAVSADTVVANRLKNAVTLRIQESISGIKNHRVNISLGTLIGGEIISGIGPSVPLFISLSGNVTSDFESCFEQGGLNQTVHKLSLRVSTEINILMPLSSVSTLVETSVLISETVIVGSVPSGAILRTEAG